MKKPTVPVHPLTHAMLLASSELTRATREKREIHLLMECREDARRAWAQAGGPDRDHPDPEVAQWCRTIWAWWERVGAETHPAAAAVYGAWLSLDHAKTHGLPMSPVLGSFAEAMQRWVLVGGPGRDSPGIVGELLTFLWREGADFVLKHAPAGAVHA